MQYRKMGNTGVSVSALGFGCMRFPLLEDGKTIDQAQAIGMLRSAIDAGMNYVDTAYFYHDQQSEPLVGKALEDGYRDKVNLATKMPVFAVEKPEDFDTYLENQLQRLQTDHIDFYLLHALSRNTWRNKVLAFGLLDKMKKARDEGKIRFLGFSFHDSEDAFLEILNGFDQWDFCQIQMNYIDVENQATLRGLEAAAAKGLGVVIMEPLLGGKLANLSPQVKGAALPGPFPGGMGPGFPLESPGSLCYPQRYGKRGNGAPEPGIRQPLPHWDAGRGAAGHAGPDPGSLSENGPGALHQVRILYAMSPFGLDIPGIYEIYNQTVNDSREDTVKKYDALTVKADACRKCRKCEGICPQHITSSTLMPKIHETISKMKADLKKE